jgi:hypothetical protein
MEEFEIDYEGVVFEVLAEYCPEQRGSYEVEPIPHSIDIGGVFLGENCVDFMLNDRALRELSKLVLERYYE